jgi:adenylate cyclase
VVELIAANPSVLKLRGERRPITSLFTDIEGFTAMTHRAQPEALVALLDEYFEGVAQIVIDHGGTIDKLVGDALHAFFNTPLDLADHPVRAVHCAIAIRAWTEAYRKTSPAAALGLGRTRIGVETGDAVVGDVGIRAKLDYTAYGDAVNSASRLEAANKELGSSICIGPKAASHCPPDLLRPTGMIRLRGFTETVCTYEPRPTDTDTAVAASVGSSQPILLRKGASP